MVKGTSGKKQSAACVRRGVARIMRKKAKANDRRPRAQQLAIAYSEARKHCRRK